MIAPSRVILVATDSDHLGHAVVHTLLAAGHQVRPVDAHAGPAPAGEAEPAACLVLESDLGSPRIAALLAAVTERYPGLPVVLVQSDGEIRGWGSDPHGGFRGYLPAPYSAQALTALVERALRNAPAAALSVPTPESAMPRQELAAAALETLVEAMEAKDPHLPGHSLRVSELAASIAARLGRAEWEVEEVRLAGRLHDLGMIAIDDAIFTRAGPLTAAEYAEVKRHPVLGHDILSGYPYMERVASYVRGHHERWDGTGYPDGLMGAAIPWGAQVLAAAETFDAMTTSRSYRSANSLTQTLDRMFAQQTDSIDPAVMRILARVVSRREVPLEQFRDALMLEPALRSNRTPRRRRRQ